MYHEKQEQIFLPKRELLRDVPANASLEDFAQAHKYFIFSDVKEKVPEIAAPQIAQAPAESQQIIKILKHLLTSINLRNYMPDMQSKDLFYDFLTTIHEVYFRAILILK
jgi:hypothetical protein